MYASSGTRFVVCGGVCGGCGITKIGDQKWGIKFGDHYVSK